MRSAIDGDDAITATIDGDFSGLATYSTNRINGGTGNDTIKAVAEVDSNGGWHALNVVEGGTGHDTIVATASASSSRSRSAVVRAAAACFKDSAVRE